MQVHRIMVWLCLAPVAALALSHQAPAQVSTPTVCREGCKFSDLNAAIKATPANGEISLAPGTYNACGVVDKPLHLIGLKDDLGRRAHLAGAPCQGKGALVLKASDIIIEGFEISDIAVPAKNGACIRIDPQAGDITIRDLYCHDSENGVLGGPANGSVTIEDSRFERNGANQGFAHGIYINAGDNFVLRHSEIISTKELGHTLKSGAKRTIVEDSVLAALDGRNSRAIDVYAGGVLEVRRSVIQQGKNSDNSAAIGIALEPKRINPEPHSTLIEDNWIIFDDLDKSDRWLFRAKQFGPITLRGNKIVGMTDLAKKNLMARVENDRPYQDREEAGLSVYDGTLSSLPEPGS